MKFQQTAAIGAAIWAIALLLVRPDIHHDAWARLLLALAVLVWVPLVFRLLHYPAKAALPVFIAAMVLTYALFLPAGMYSGIAALPWLAVSFYAFQKGIEDWIRPAGNRNIARAAGQVFLVIGGIWAVFDRFGWRPLDFDPAIVLLTAVHFHYAGFIFPFLVGKLFDFQPGKPMRIAALLAVLAVPLTAMGITLSQLTGQYSVEILAAATVAISGWITAFYYVLLVKNQKLAPISRILALVLGACLLFSMTLAMGYAIRPIYTFSLLEIPTMRAWHGTANAIGVAGAGIGLWSWATRSN